MTTRRALSKTAFALALFLSMTQVYAASQPLTPSRSNDDTAQLQAALARCTNPAKPCDLRLGKGVFHTDVLLVKGFYGSITGSGEGKTIIEPLTNRPLRSSPLPFFAEPTLAQPYPVLIHFANGGKVSISRLTMRFPASMRVAAYDFYLNGEDGIGIEDSLLSAILMDGQQSSELSMTNVTIIGTDNDSFYGSNLYNAVRFEGQLRFTADADLTRKLKKGRFVAYNNTLLRTGNGICIEDTNNTEGLVVRNEIDARVYGLTLTNLGGSRISAVRNVMRGGLEGIFVAQTPERPPQTRSDYLLAQNIININEDNDALDPAGAYDGIGVFDFAAYEEPPRGETFLANVTIADNDITVRDDAVLNGITVSGDGKGLVSVLGNRIYGAPLDAGVFVDLSRGTIVTLNDLSAVEGEAPDVALTETTRNCRVIQPRDIVSDLGTNNHVIGIPQSSPLAKSKAAAGLLSARKDRPAPRKRL